MDVQRVDSEVVGVHVEGSEDFFQRDLLAALLQDHAVGIHLVGGLYKLQQMLLVHAGGSMYVCVHLNSDELHVRFEQISNSFSVYTTDRPF